MDSKLPTLSLSICLMSLLFSTLCPGLHPSPGLTVCSKEVTANGSIYVTFRTTTPQPGYGNAGYQRCFPSGYCTHNIGNVHPDYPCETGEVLGQPPASGADFHLFIAYWSPASNSEYEMLFIQVGAGYAPAGLQSSQNSSFGPGPTTYTFTWDPYPPGQEPDAIRVVGPQGFITSVSTSATTVTVQTDDPTSISVLAHDVDSGILPTFIRGDVNSDGSVDVADVVGSLAVLFQGQSASCQAALDANDDGSIDISDPVRTLHFLFSGGAPLPAPNACNQFSSNPEQAFANGLDCGATFCN